MVSLPTTQGSQSTMSTVFEYSQTHSSSILRAMADVLPANDKWVRRIVVNEDLLGVRSNLHQASQNMGTKIM